MRAAVLVLSVLGALFFGGALLLSWANPLLVERATREVLRIEVERRVEAGFDGPSGSSLAALARHARSQSDPRTRATWEAIRRELPWRVEKVIARMHEADCPCRQRLTTSAAETGGLGTWLQHRGRLSAFIESAYGIVSRQLMREYRIFTASNALAFLLLGAITLARPKASLQLLLPALVLVCAVAVTAGFYLFGQDWLHTIVFGDYVGWGYALYLAGVAAFLADIAFNHARVSTEVVNLALQAAGSAASAVPC
jgi:hypothetical protein